MASEKLFDISQEPDKVRDAFDVSRVREHVCDTRRRQAITALVREQRSLNQPATIAGGIDMKVNTTSA